MIGILETEEHVEGRQLPRYESKYEHLITSYEIILPELWNLSVLPPASIYYYRLLTFLMPGSKHIKQEKKKPYKPM